MSPSARDPKYAYGAAPIAMPSGWNPSGSRMVAGREPRWAASAGAAPSTTASAAVVTSARVRLDKMTFLPGGSGLSRSCTPEMAIEFKLHTLRCEHILAEVRRDDGG